MQLFEICDKKHMIWCSFKGHNLTSFIIIIITKLRQNTVQWYAFKHGLLFLNAATFRGISGQTHEANIKK